MFLGEFSCLGVFYLLVWRDQRRPEPSMAPSQPFSPLLFLPPALCDMTGTSIMYVGKCWGRGHHRHLPLPCPAWGNQLSPGLDWAAGLWFLEGEMTPKPVRGVGANPSHLCNELCQVSGLSWRCVEGQRCYRVH